MMTSNAGIVIIALIILIVIIVASRLIAVFSDKQDKKSSNALFEEYVMDKEAIKPDANKSEILPENAQNSPASSVDPLLNKLMGYDDMRLRKIIDASGMYNPEVVMKAQEILGKRGAWEQIKDLPDETLMEIAMTDSELYTDYTVEAASMELYQRDSQLLKSKFMQMLSQLPSIADGSAPAPEGIRLAAQKYLTKK